MAVCFQFRHTLIFYKHIQCVIGWIHGCRSYRHMGANWIDCYEQKSHITEVNIHPWESLVTYMPTWFSKQLFWNSSLGKLMSNAWSTMWLVTCSPLLPRVDRLLHNNTNKRTYLTGRKYKKWLYALKVKIY